MAFGRIMRVGAGEIQLELAPLRRSDMPQFVQGGGLQLHSVARYLARIAAPAEEDEFDWFDKLRTDPSRFVWGIYVISGDQRTLIGNTGLNGIEEGIVRQATSGIVIFRPEYWGKGVASAAHLARTMYACEQLGLHRVRSAVINGNLASYQALHRVGYETVCVERNTIFVDGKLRHQRNLELLNPLEPFWSVWWGDDQPTATALAARARTLQALELAHQRVTLP